MLLKNTVFKQYNTAVVVTFVIIVFIALAASTFRYYSELSVHKQQGLEQLTSHARELNSMLEQSEHAISGVQEFAEYALKYPDELHLQLPELKQDDSLFYLDKATRGAFGQTKQVSGNITGFGNVAQFSSLKKQEIAMANALTPAFVATQKVIEEANWFYYVSLEQFVNIFPWIGRDSWRFSEHMLTSAHAKKIQNLGFKNNKVIWSSPYIDAADTGMNVSLGIGVYRSQKMLGAVIIDISLARLHQSLPTLTSEDQGMVLYNSNSDILIFKEKGKESLEYKASWQKILPEGLHLLNPDNLKQLPDSVHIGDWLIEKQTLLVNGWTLLKYQSYSNFILPLRSHFVYMFAILLVGLIAFLMLVNAMTRRSFIKPTYDFIRHIEYCAQGEPEKVKANADWLHWFELVEGIFTQNRSLLLQLQEQNEVLDGRILEKIQALQETSTKHQRDYVLLRSVMNAIPDLIIFNDPQGKLIGCNQAFEKLSGCIESDMLGCEVNQFMPKALAHEIKLLNQNIEKKHPKQELLEAGDESYQVFCNQLVNEHDEILGIITILQDVTERQATQLSLESAKNQAEYANQVKIQFLANMSHEIRTPINAMQGMMDLLTRTILDSRQQHYLANAQTAALSLLHLIDELLDLSKIEAGKMVVIKDIVDLPATIDKALKLNTANIYSKKLNMRVELASNVPNILMSDEMRLVQVLSNLLNNAIKFTEQGDISLLIDSIGLSETNALVRFKIIDTGIGIHKDKQGHLFEAFSQADISMTRKYGGSGLGLSICQQIVKLLGGEITLKSDIGKGCEFSFVLPFSLPSEEIKQNLGLKNASSINTNEVHLCVIRQKLSTSCIKTIEDISWHYREFNDLLSLNQHFAAKNLSNAKMVLLISENVFLQQEAKLNETEENQFEIFDLIGICQPTMRELSSDICTQLDKVNATYILLDTPLYRYSLDQIARELVQVIEEKDMLALIENANKPLALTKEPLVYNTEDLSSVKVLLVEDNLVNQLVAKELLMSTKATVMIADNGQSALDLLDENTFDIVLMDIQMPIMDGLTATMEIRKQEKYQNLPIIAMTAHAREEDKLRSLAAGMNLHIAKPVTAQLLLTSILQVLECKTV